MKHQQREDLTYTQQPKRNKSPVQFFSGRAGRGSATNAYQQSPDNQQIQNKQQASVTKHPDIAPPGQERDSRNSKATVSCPSNWNPAY
ncbi:hypothetical protein Nepgr_006709 [Nepenthes gracilis]|uniref:Uncharacterized protein n=1 Tax=Nepenthes gracilis TaxID=150966 RepID=A0AAD3S5V2_NEPGR|nr:hypothetical protein Nepgr_006709 [Nepenthes gracilis]